MCPWNDFEQHKSSKINGECEFSHIRHRVFQSHGAQKMEKQDLAKALEEKVPVWASEYGGKLNAILRGSNTAFKQAKNRRLDQWKAISKHP